MTDIEKKSDEYAAYKATKGSYPQGFSNESQEFQAKVKYKYDVYKKCESIDPTGSLRDYARAKALSND